MDGTRPDVGMVPAPLVRLVWRDLWPLLEPAWRRSRDKDDLPAGLAARRLQLWAIYEGGMPVAAVVTRLNRHCRPDGMLDCRVWLVGGRGLARWLPDLLERLVAWARAEGCACLSGAGRKGWARIAHRLGCVPAGEEEGDTVWRLALSSRRPPVSAAG
ncbi:hypothetical protein [Enhydrobacter sp.]|jgi:hypothetical protein|uniref:hypothetical protein n=1 Tax=Enhydrobacter sp. TaxID=1894999 RepID=UPI0026018E53|nr:hypothetical protein [Enhydrobacter sp.]WIM14490.1 MAG: hypothetical protein OJF58_005460 [Enhydrobacter sp.]